MDYIVHILPNMFSGLAVSAKIFVLTFVLAFCWPWSAFPMW